MTITIEISEEATRRLREKAAAAGRPLEEYLRDEVESLAEVPHALSAGLLAGDEHVVVRIIDDATIA